MSAALDYLNAISNKIPNKKQTNTYTMVCEQLQYCMVFRKPFSELQRMALLQSVYQPVQSAITASLVVMLH